MEITVLCSGSRGNSTLVRTARFSLLIDVGMSTKKYLKDALAQAGSCLEDIDAVLVTHSHSDHIKQLKAVLGKPVYSWCPLDPGPCAKSAPEFIHYEILPWKTYGLGDITVQTIGLSHDAGKTLGFVLLADGQKLVYITDTGFVRKDAEPLLRDADYYIMESNHDPMMLEHTRRPRMVKQRILSEQGHMDNEYASRLLCRLITPRTRKVVLAHLSQEANTPGLAISTFESTLEECGMDPASLQIEAASQDTILHVTEPHPDGADASAADQASLPLRLPEVTSLQ